MGSCAEPASTRVKKEKTGASGRSQIRRVMPFGSFLTVMRFSKDATSCARAKAERRKKTAAAFRVWCFIKPPASSSTHMCWTDVQGRSLKVRVGKGSCQTCSSRDSEGQVRNNAVFCVPRYFGHNSSRRSCDRFDRRDSGQASEAVEPGEGALSRHGIYQAAGNRLLRS